MSDLDWDDPNYVEGPVKPRAYAKVNEKHETSVRRDAEPRRYQEGGRRDDYGSEKRNTRDNLYGRSNRDNDGGSGARRSSFVVNDFSETLPIAAEMVAKVIGRGGENIKRIQNDFNVRAKVDRENLVVKIYGSLQRNVSDAMNVVRKQVSDSGRRPDRDDGDSLDGGSRRPYGGSNPPTVDTPQSGDLTGIIDWDALKKASDKAAAARWAKCPPLTKDFYEEQPEVANLSASVAQKIRKENNGTTVSHVFEAKDGETLAPIPNPVWKFEQCFAKYPDLLKEVMKQGFSKPSPIQAQAWPILLKGHDMIGIAQTGTGKTLAFLLPGMIHTEYQCIPRGQRSGPNVLILAPTRELALQIEMEVKKYPFRGMRAVCIYGGGDRCMQISDMKRGAEIIICTPGRLNDLVEAKVIDVRSISYLVLDEADRMLDMGFEPQIRKVLLDIRPDRQTIMTSATWPPGVRRLSQRYMKNPIQVCVGSLDLAATHSVKQIIKLLKDDDEKYTTIKSFVNNMSETDKIIVFCGRKARADDLSSDLTLDGFYTQCIHGNLDQSDREQAIADIKSGVVRILVATDVASRGLDIEDISHVINYDFPPKIEEYVHRVGRTGRAGRKGTSISFITSEDWGMAKDLIAILKEAGQEVPKELYNMATRFQAMKKQGGGKGRFGGNMRGGRNFDRWQY
ncbi:hypothetical protein KR074_001672 [Drosophila pseudoananassae]|nr:hypothetical protein KR074_001672 [Drosophila pseudoananassae]